jgi:hypothetical protein
MLLKSEKLNSSTKTTLLLNFQTVGLLLILDSSYSTVTVKVYNMNESPAGTVSLLVCGCAQSP